MDCEEKKHVKYTQEQLNKMIKQLDESSFKSFLQKNKQDLHLNSCLVKNCGPQSLRCQSDSDLAKQIKQCFSMPCFQKKWGRDQSLKSKNRCQLNCEIDEKISIYEKEFFINDQENKLKKFKDFLNPYHDHHVKFGIVQSCIASTQEFQEYFKKIGGGTEKFSGPKIDQIMYKALNACFIKEFKNQLNWFELKQLKCAFYCHMFEPQLKNKMIHYGEMLAEGKIKNLDRIFF